MPNPSTIERLPDESARAFAARTEYVLLGPQRSLDALAQKYNKSRSLFARWSTEYDWAATARAWDDQQAAAALDRASEAYQAELADYRRRYGEMGKALLGASAKMLNRMMRDLEAMEMTPAVLGQITSAVKTAADVEALALRLEGILQDERSSQ